MPARITLLTLLLILMPMVSMAGEKPPVREEAIKAHMEFLASDLLKGREAGEEGYDIAAAYVASQFQQYGLKPAGNEGSSYFQMVPLQAESLDETTAELELERGQEKTKFKLTEDFATRGSIGNKDACSGQLVYVGFGIKAPERNYDDYQGLEVKGKILVMAYGAPKDWPTAERAHYHNMLNKLKMADEQGAAGVILFFPRQAEKRHPYVKFSKYITKHPSYWWLNEDGQRMYMENMSNMALVNSEVAAQLFEGSAQSLEQVLDALEKDESQGFALQGKMRLKALSQKRQFKSKNVCAVLEGSDPKLKDQYLVFSAHLDHVGVSKDGEGDTIYNGALDNASGIASMLEIARIFAQEKTRPKRSILFLAATAEEKGLLGSDYFAHYPTVPIENITANINLDMPVILYPMKDIIAFGAEHSSLKDPVARACAEMGLTLSPDPVPEEGLFTRSDHYSFVKKGIPSIFVVVGFQSSDPAINGGEIAGEFIKKHYHKPSDQLDLPIDYTAGVVFTQVNYLIAREVADAETAPAWNENDFFGNLFGRKKP